MSLSAGNRVDNISAVLVRRLLNAAFRDIITIVFCGSRSGR